MSRTVETLPMSNTAVQLTFWSEERPARASPSQEREWDWTTRVVTWHSSSFLLLAAYGPGGWSGRTCPESCRSTEDGRLEPSSGRWRNAGTGSPTGFLTLDTSEFHSAGVVCLLSHILETGDLPQRYYLSTQACAGILRRAERRGKTLPENLMRALESATSR